MFDQTHPNYAGDLGLLANPKLVARIKASDLVIVGGRAPQPDHDPGLYAVRCAPQKHLVHAYPEAEELGRIFPPRLAIHATPQRFAAALDGLSPARRAALGGGNPRRQCRLSRFLRRAPAAAGRRQSQRSIMIWLREHLPADAIIANGAGGFAAWIHRFYRFRRFATHFAPVSQSMGYGVPAAVAMQAALSGRRVVAISGDGDFLMSGQEFATAVQYGLPIICLVLDNGMYGSIRLHQERAYPGRVSATDLVNPDFAALARSFGGFGATVEKTADFADAFRAAEASGKPSLIHVKYDAEGVAAGQER